VLTDRRGGWSPEVRGYLRWKAQLVESGWHFYLEDVRKKIRTSVAPEKPAGEGAAEVAIVSNALGCPGWARDR